MVDREGQLEPLEREAVFRRHQPGIVDQEIEPIRGGEDLVRKATHLGKVGKIRQSDNDVVRAGAFDHKPPRRLGPIPVAADHKYSHPGPSEAERSIEPDAGTRPGNDSSLMGIARHWRMGCAYSCSG